jgi:hypothetical protein
VACLFVVAAGISNTGALDYYMARLLGTPKSVAGAQVRLMVPIALVSAFLNNTPVGRGGWRGRGGTNRFSPAVVCQRFESAACCVDCGPQVLTLEPLSIQ